jgi:hypothetical protein
MTNVEILINTEDASLTYKDEPTHYKKLNISNDFLLWGEETVRIHDGAEGIPSEIDLLESATVIDPINSRKVSKCFLFKPDEGLGGKLFEVDGMGMDKPYVFAFSFDGPTASEPQLEAWDDISHQTINFHVLGNGNGENSFISGVTTNVTSPGPSWGGEPIAGSEYPLLLNDDLGPLEDLPSGTDSQELYCNLKISIPPAYSEAGVENFIFSLRYTWN